MICTKTGTLDGPNTSASTGTDEAVISDELSFVNLPRTVQIQAIVKF